jgi:undecaprenyl-diphosphatase
MNFDSSIVTSLNAIASSTPAASEITVFLASWLPYLIVAGFGVYLLYTKRFRGYRKALPMLWALIAALIARLLIVSPIRFFFPRDRPFLSIPVHALIVEHAPSFPSGHASFFFGFSTVVYAYNKKLGILAFILSTIVCIARIAAAIHYPSDILAGMFVGIIAGLITVKFLRPLIREVDAIT